MDFLSLNLVVPFASDHILKAGLCMKISITYHLNPSQAYQLFLKNHPYIFDKSH
jgi:hypothetical protein